MGPHPDRRLHPGQARARRARPAPEADRPTLIRRLTFDLLGLPPTPEEVEAFVDDPVPDAYERLVDRLLASPRYGERWGRHWLDVVRFGESHGFETERASARTPGPIATMSSGLQRDMPYDHFVARAARRRRAADADGRPRSATGFLVGGTHDMSATRRSRGCASSGWTSSTTCHRHRARPSSA